MACVLASPISSNIRVLQRNGKSLNAGWFYIDFESFFHEFVFFGTENGIIFDHVIPEFFGGSMW